jgi:CheY-specific phosphatase CheX
LDTTPDPLIEPFTTAVAATLREMAGAEAVARGVSRGIGGEGPDGVSVALRLDGAVMRWVVLSLPSATAAALARRVLAGVEGEPDAGMVRDCAAEVLNVIAGQAKTLTFGTPHHFTLSTPTVLPTGPAAAGAGWWLVRFDSDAGPFSLALGPPGGTPFASTGG